MLQLIVGELGNELFKRFAGSALFFELCNPVGEKSCRTQKDSKILVEYMNIVMLFWVYYIFKNIIIRTLSS